MSNSRLVALRYPNRRMAARLTELWDDRLALLPLGPSLTGAEVGALLDELKPDLIEDESGITELPGGLPVEEGTALVIPTSGASGRPKGVELSHDALEWSARATSENGSLLFEGRLAWLGVGDRMGGLGIEVRDDEHPAIARYQGGS